MKKIYCTLVILFFVVFSDFVMAAEEIHHVKGKVYENREGNEIAVPYATVAIEGTTIGTFTDPNGHFTLDLAQGTYNLVCSFVGYTPVKRTIHVSENNSEQLDLELASNNLALQEVKITAKAKGESENMLLIQRKNSTQIVQAVGAKELSRKGASNAEQGVKKMTGISSMGNNQIYVRGLSDRYNNSTLNGVPIASPNPDTKLIPLNIFPTEVIKAVNVSKVFTASQYADFAGATIDIDTKEGTSNTFVNLSVGTGANSNTTFGTFSRSKNSSGGTNYFGYGKNKRRMPTDIVNSSHYVSTKGESDLFKNSYGYEDVCARPQLNFAVSAGTEIKIKENKLNLLGSVSFDNDYSKISGKYRVVDVEGNPLRDMNTLDDGYSTNLSALYSMNYSFGNNKQHIGYNFLSLNSSNDLYTDNAGLDQNYGDHVLRRRLVYDQHQLYNNQLKGEHEISDRWSIDWKANVAVAKSFEPDRMDLKFIRNDDGGYTIFQDLTAVERYYQTLKENEYSGNIEATYKLSTDKLSQIKWGAQYKSKDRDFYSRSFNYTGNRDVEYNPYDETTEYFSEENFRDGSTQVQEDPRVWSDYFAHLRVASGFAEFSHTINEKWIANIGLRIEAGNQTVDYKLDGDIATGNYRKAQIKKVDLFPSLNLKYNTTQKSDMKFSFSRTMTRPDFKEMSPFRYIDLNNDETRGNASIQNSYNYNFELGYELFPNSSELISFSVFGKYLQNPIERYIKQSSAQIFSYTNTQSGYIVGFEMEYKKSFNSFLDESSPLSKMFVGFNVSYLYSMIHLGDDALAIGNTNSERSLEGASPFLINADINYPLELKRNNSILFSLLYNVYGKRITSVGTNGLEDIYEMPVHTLDLMATANLNDKFGIKLSGKNLLNSKIEEKQNTQLGTQTLKSYRKGVDVSLGFNYRF